MSRLPLIAAISVVAAVGGAVFALATRPAPEPAAAPVTAAALKQLPEIRLQGLDGRERDIREWSDRPQLINFWATWCAPCRKEMPLLEALHQQQPGIAVIGIAIDREEPVKRFIAETGVSYPILRGEADAMAVAESFGPAFAALPFTVIAAPGGEILELHTGELKPEQLSRLAAVLSALAAGELTVAEAKQQLAESRAG